MLEESPTCRWILREVESGTELTGSQAGEAVRSSLRKAGLQAASVTPQDMLVVLRKVLPRELAFLGVSDSVTFCEELAQGLRTADLPVVDDDRESAEEVFRRLFEAPP